MYRRTCIIGRKNIISAVSVRGHLHNKGTTYNKTCMYLMNACTPSITIIVQGSWDDSIWFNGIHKAVYTRPLTGTIMASLYTKLRK